MDGSSSDDDDMPMLRNTSPGGHSPATQEVGEAEKAEGGEEGEEGDRIKKQEALDPHAHPASRGVLIPQKLFSALKLHPASMEPVVRDAKLASQLKEEGNTFFKSGQLRRAEECYSEALLTVPLTPDHEYSRAVFHGNRAACYLKMTLYDKCIADCTEAIGLSPKYVKVILRRSKAYELQEKWDEAIKDLETVLQIEPMHIFARNQAMRLDKIRKEKQEAMKEEVIGKLKSLGNTILGKFGLSLDNFKMKKDPSTGSYSMSFEQ